MRNCNPQKEKGWGKMDINRDALLLYLRDLRDMEMAKYQIGKMIRQAEADYRSDDAQLQGELQRAQQISDPGYWILPPKEKEKEYAWSGSTGLYIMGIIIGIMMLAVIVPCISFGLLGTSILPFLFILVIACGAIVFFCIARIITEASQERKYREELEKTNAQIRARNWEKENRVRQHNAEVPELQQKNALIRAENKKKYGQLRTENQKKWDERKQFLEDEKKKVQGILDKAYSENILPAPYRSLAPLYYIYDYMATSRESFEDTLMHEHLENGFQRILARLDTIVNNQAEEIFTLHRMEAQNTVIIAQNEAMLDELEQIDVSIRDSSRQINATLGDIRDNTYQTAQYAQQTSQYAQQASQYAGIAATYSAVNAYFSWADYLKN